MSSVRDLNDAWILLQFARLPMEIRERDFAEYEPQVSDSNKDLFKLLCGKVEASNVDEAVVAQFSELEKIRKPFSIKRYRGKHRDWRTR